MNPFLVSYFVVIVPYGNRDFICCVLINTAPVCSNRPLPEELKSGEPNLVITQPGEPGRKYYCVHCVCIVCYDSLVKLDNRNTSVLSL